MKKLVFIIFTYLMALLLVSCGAAETSANVVATETPNVLQKLESTGSDELASKSEQDSDQIESGQPDLTSAPNQRPAWQETALTNARTGETFTLSDFTGKPVFVEPMATWCTNCRRQLTNVRDAKEQLGDGAVFVALSVETNIEDATLASYANDAGFDWLFAVATPEILDGLTAEFGRAIVNPPATPHFIIRADGSYTDLFTGIDPTAEIVTRLTAIQG